MSRGALRPIKNMRGGKMKKVAIIGHFGGNENFYDGQTVKTRIFAKELEGALTENEVIRIDTYGWRKHPFRLLRHCVSAVRNAKNVLFLTDEGGIKIFPWLLLALNFFWHRKLHYVVVGGWLVNFPAKHRFLAACLKRLDYIWVETSYMKGNMEAQGFRNIHLLPNFKNLSPLSEEELVYIKDEPYPFCTFSRVMKEKGIEDAVNVIKQINSEYGRVVCTLDIYGSVDAKQTEWFEELSSQFTEAIRYCGMVPYDQSVEVIKNYYALLFPTRYMTEGVPGTIIDAYAAGVPVIASRWHSFADVVDDGITGIGYPCLHNEYLEKVMMEAIRSTEKINVMKKQCLKKANEFLPSHIVGLFLDHLECKGKD